MTFEPGIKLPRTYLFLDGIRGLAAFWVLLCHLNGAAQDCFPPGSPAPRFPALLNFIWYGRDAVGIFIVLSGFCLMLPIALDPTGSLRGGLSGFLKRRARRILPAYYASVALSIITTYLSHLTRRYVGIAASSSDWTQDLAPLPLISHILLIHNWTPQTTSSINAVLWSVAVEWQIYIIFALVLVPVWQRYRCCAGANRIAA